MKRTLPISMVALLITLLLTACSTASGEPPEHYQERASTALMEARGDAEQLEEALAIYAEGLEEHPDNPELRNGRAQLLVNLGRYEAAKQDLDVLYEGELHKEGMLLRCMLNERLEGATDDALACYEEVENAYAGEASDPPDANHILAARLSGSPQAEALLQEWQASEKADPMLGETLKMEREGLIQQFLP
ncbi:tetratricopeptide repeat protein [Litchfieldella rifensis]|uniref:Tetratricopeptide repeat protein n=1 Tax=Litchfieldella rifensis TaxID=762643 RepID=A0ABV7LQ22_9GAMM